MYDYLGHRHRSRIGISCKQIMLNVFCVSFALLFTVRITHKILGSV